MSGELPCRLGEILSRPKNGGRKGAMILTKVGGGLMNNGSVLSRGAAVGFLLGLAWATFPSSASAAVGNTLRTIIPATAASCGPQGGTSIAIVPGRKLAGVNSVAHPLLLAITCLDNNDVTKRSTVYFISVSTGAVVKSLTTKISGLTAAPGN